LKTRWAVSRMAARVAIPLRVKGRPGREGFFFAVMESIQKLNPLSFLAL
jgi:hypothetical protein